MVTGRSIAVVVGVLVTATLTSVGIPALDPELIGSGAVRLALGVCAVAFGLIAAMYARDEYRDQAIGHALAGIGFAVVAIGAEGTTTWIGLCLLGVGGLLLLRATHGHDKRGRISV